MAKFIKKLFTIALSLALVLVLIPITNVVRADSELSVEELNDLNTAQSQFGITFKAKIGETEYTHLAYFFQAYSQTTEGTVTLESDIALPDNAVYIPVFNGQNITLDFNGHKIIKYVDETNKWTTRAIEVKAGGTLTLTDSGTNGGIEAFDDCILNYGTLVLNGGTFTSHANYAEHNRWYYAIRSEGTLTVPNDSTAVVSGTHGGLAIIGGNATINGGSFSTAQYYGLWIENNSGSNVVVNGGTFQGGANGGNKAVNVGTNDEDCLSIRGGRFNSDPTAYLADGYKVTETAGIYTVSEANYVAQIGDAKYETLADAINAANADTSSNAITIKLLADLDFSDDEYKAYKWAGSTYNPLRITRSNVTLDLNEKTISNMGNSALCLGSIYARDGVIENVTIKNGTLLAGTTDNVINSYALLIGGVNNCLVDSITTLGGINNCNNSNVIIKDSTIKGTKYYTVCAQTGADVTIRGTSYTKNTDQTVQTKAMFWVQGAGTDEDLITSSNPTGAFDASIIAIESGYFNVDSNGAFYLGGGLAPTLKGGYYNIDPTAYVADGYAVESVSEEYEGVTYTYHVTAKKVAQIGDAKYETLAAAIAAVATDGTKTTIQMINDEAIANETITVATGKNIVLDLNGKTVSGTSDKKSVYFISNAGTLEITDTSANKDGKITFQAVADTGYSVENVAVLNEGGTLTLTEGTVENTTAGGLTYAIKNSSNAWANSVISTFNMTGGRVTAPQGDGAVRVYQNTGIGWKVESKNYVNISGGTIVDTGMFIDTFLYTVNQDATNFNNDDLTKGCVIDTVINISGGTINGLIDLKVRHPYNTEINISGGDFTNCELRTRKVNSEYGKSLKAGEISEPTEPMFNITGGKFAFKSNGRIFVVNPDQNYSFTTDYKPYYVDGGVFNVDLNNYAGLSFAEGKKGVANVAADTKDAYPYTVGNAYVAQIGDVKYETLDAAVVAANDDDTIVLLADLTQDNGIIFNKSNSSVKLDLNGKTFTVNTGSNANNRAIKIVAGTLEVYNGTVTAVGAGTTSANGTGCYGAFRVEADGVLNGHDLVLNNSRPWGLNVKVLGGEATLTDVTINSSYGGGIEVTEATLGSNSKKGSATLTNCTINQENYFDHCSTALSVSGGSKLIVNSGSYTGEYALYVFSSGGEIEINGGTFTGLQNSGRKAFIAAIDLGSYPQYEGGLVLNDGNFVGDFAITSPAYASVSGGLFTTDPTAYVAEGYKAVEIEDPTYSYKVVEDVTYVAQIGDAKYETLNAAVADAKAGDTIVLINDLTTSTYPYVDKNITLDLNGYTAELGGQYGLIVSGSNLVVTDNSTNGDGKIVSTARYGVFVQLGGTLTVNGGTIETAYGNNGYAIYVHGGSANKDRVVVNAGNIVAGSGAYCIFGYNASEVEINGGAVTSASYGIAMFKTSKLTVNGGTITGNTYPIATNGNSGQNAQIIITGGTIGNENNGSGIYLPSGSLDVSGGTITGKTGIYFKSTNLNITGGEIVGVGPAVEYNYSGNGSNSTGDALVIDSCGYPNGIDNVNVSGGHFVSANAAAVKVYTYQENEPVEKFITGGIYNTLPDAEYVADGYKAVYYEGNYQVGPVSYEAVTEGSIEGTTVPETITYNVNKVVKEDETASAETMASETSFSVEVSANAVENNTKAVASLGNIKDDATLKAIVEKAVEAAGSAIDANTTSATIEITVAKGAADVVNNKVTYEVHPEALIKVNDEEVASVKIENEDLEGTFTFKLYAGNITQSGKYVKVTHIHSDNTSEDLGELLVDAEGYVTVTGVESFSDFTLEIVETEVSAYAKFGYTISLEESINIVFNVKDLTDDLNTYTVEYIDPSTGEIVEKVPTNATLNSYVIAKCAAKQMGDVFTVVVKHNGTQINQTTDFSIKNYCDTIINGNFSTYIKDLCKATLDYGRYAQEGFDYYGSGLVNDGNDNFDNSAISVPDYAGQVVSNTFDGELNVSFSLTTESQTILNIYLTGVEANNYSVLVNGEETMFRSLGPDKIQVSITGIKAKDLGEKITIQVNDAGSMHELVYKVSPVDYMGFAVGHNSQVLINRAFYNYYLKAVDYFNNK